MIKLLERAFNKYNDKGYLKFVPDKICLHILYHMYFGKKLNLENPKSFNEKLQWLKLYDRKLEYTTMVDKYEVKKFVSEKINKEYIIPTIGVWDRFDDIDFGLLPKQFVLKCTHDSGGLVIVRDKDHLDRTAAKKKIETCLNKNFYYTGREWPYKNVKHRIIAEQYMSGSDESNLKDYKFFCFNGEPKVILVCSDRFSKNGLRENFYDIEWNEMPFSRPKNPNTEYPIKKPDNLPVMVELSRTLAKHTIFSRIDLYEIKGRVYFGEITFFPASGFEQFSPGEWDFILGDWLKLPNKY